MLILKKLSLLALLAAFVVSVGACNMVEGAAQGGEEDIEETGDNIEDAFD